MSVNCIEIVCFIQFKYNSIFALMFVASVTIFFLLIWHRFCLAYISRSLLTLWNLSIIKEYRINFRLISLFLHEFGFQTVFWLCLFLRVRIGDRKSTIKSVKFWGFFSYEHTLFVLFLYGTFRKFKVRPLKQFLKLWQELYITTGSITGYLLNYWHF